MERILLIEDETFISEPLAFLLRRSGFDVMVVGNGLNAIQVFDHARVDLILLDLQLPGVPGMHLCRQLRQRSEVPIIMLTARDTVTDTVAGLEAGADDYVTKPFSSGELIARMRAVLRRLQPPEPASPPVVGSGRVQMDVDQHEITVDGSPVSLPLKSFHLLEVLLRSPGQLLTRGELIDRVWGLDSGVESRALAAQITRLRKVLETNPGDPQHRHTVRGLGYVYDP